MPTDIDDLASTLFGLETRGMSTRAVTALITGAILRWALARGWSARTEARVHAAPVADHDRRLGFIDVIVRRAPAGRDLAIEIDSGDKPWSVAKLRHAADAGMHPVWVRWGDDRWAGAFEDIDVIQLRTLRAPAARAGSEQLSLW